MTTSRDTFHDKSIVSAVRDAGGQIDAGLDSAEVVRRKATHGANELPRAQKTSKWQVFARQFVDFMVLLLLTASIISFALGDVVEAGAILAIVLINATIGFVQEWRADAALNELRKLSGPGALVERDGLRQTVPSSDLVPGDLIFLEAGNYVPADARLVESANLLINEAALTGESNQAQKDADVELTSAAPLAERLNMVFSGTLVARGRGRAIVTAIGLNTEIGTIAKLMAAVEDERTPLQHKLNQLGRTLSIAALATCALTLVLQLARTTDLSMVQSAGAAAYFLTHAVVIHQAFLLAISLAVAAVPEGLSAVVTINLALGMRAMARQHALVRRLHAVETLGSTTVICSDKTGTMTQNSMLVVRAFAGSRQYVVSGKQYDPVGEFKLPAPDSVETTVDPAASEHRTLHELLRAGLLCSDAILEPHDGAFRMVGDPTEGALVAAAGKAGMVRGPLELASPRLLEIPFEAERRLMTTVHQNGTQCVAFVKGAPEVVIPRMVAFLGDDFVAQPSTAQTSDALHKITNQMAGQALRVIAVAYKDVACPTAGATPDPSIETGLTLIGLMGMIDPPRPEVPAAIRIAQQAGVRTLMITGDNPVTALAIARQVGIGSAQTDGPPDVAEVLLGHDLDALSDEALSLRLQTTQVFARVSPQHKLRVVKLLRNAGQIVAMTGDGVNDAPALKQADIGVAMGLTGTDVSKEVADIVLTDDNFASIVTAIGEGRVIYANIRKFVAFLVKTNVAEIMIILIASLLGWASPFNVIQLLWLNLISDGAPALALGMEPAEPGVMKVPPRRPNEKIINKPMLMFMLVQASALTIVVLGVYAWAQTFAPAEAGTMAFLLLAASELALAYGSRSETASMFSIGLLRNRMLQIATLFSTVLLLATIYVPPMASIFHTVPLSPIHLGIVVLASLIPTIVSEIVKAIARFYAKTSAGNLPTRPADAVS